MYKYKIDKEKTVLRITVNSYPFFLSNSVILLVISFFSYYDNIKECDTMIYPSIDKLLNIVSSKYELVHISARRSKEMAKHEDYQLRENEYNCSKNIGRALEEVLEGKLTVVESQD